MEISVYELHNTTGSSKLTWILYDVLHQIQGMDKAFPSAKTLINTHLYDPI